MRAAAAPLGTGRRAGYELCTTFERGDVRTRAERHEGRRAGPVGAPEAAAFRREAASSSGVGGGEGSETAGTAREV